MQDIFGSVRKSFADAGAGCGAASASIADRIGSRLRRSGSALGLGLGPHPKPPSPPLSPAAAPPIRWRRGELIGRGAFGSVYLGMNLDSGELLAVKQVSIGTRDASRERARAHIRELEDEVKLLKSLSHPNIVRYLGTAREEDSLNILLEFVSGGSISSMLGNLGSFPEKVIRKYTKQLLQGLEYLHRNKIMHRDIKGANILVHDNGCIKLADFGASKQVAQLATITAAKSMKGTPYWMAPEVIVQSGHSFSADIWSVGCTVIEMATGKPPWSQQYQEVAALFHVGTTQSHPPIPDCLSSEAKDFLLKCLQREPNSRATAADLLQHPFITKEYRDPHSLYRSSVVKPPIRTLPTTSFDKKMTSTTYPEKLWQMSTSNDMCHWDDRDDMCRLDDDDAFPVVGSSFNPMSEPCDDWTGQFNASLEQKTESQTFGDSGNGFRFPCDPAVEDVNEVTETKIRAFLREKADDLKRMQTPLFEFYNTLNVNNFPVANSCEENATNNSRLPSKSNRSPNKVLTGMASTLHVDLVNNMSTENSSMRVSSSGLDNNRVLKEILSPRLNGREDILQDNQEGPNSPSVSSRDWTNFCERKKKKWEEELDQYITIQREMKRQEGLGAKSPTAGGNRKRDSSGFNSPAK